MNRLELSSELRHLKTVRLWLGKVCREAGMNREQSSDLQLAVGEAFTNCVEHGYDYDPEGTVKLRADLLDDCLIVLIQDRGKSFDVDLSEEPDLSEAHEGGYGLFLMKRLTDRIEIVSDDAKGTTITLTKRIPPILETEEVRPPTGEPAVEAVVDKVSDELFGKVKK